MKYAVELINLKRLRYKCKLFLFRVGFICKFVTKFLINGKVQNLKSIID